MKPEAERQSHEVWPDIEPGAKYVGIGGGMRGYECTALSQTETSFGHKHAYVIWTDKVPPGVVADEKGGSTVRTSLLDDVREEPVEPQESEQPSPEQKAALEG